MKNLNVDIDTNTSFVNLMIIVTVVVGSFTIGWLVGSYVVVPLLRAMGVL